MRLFDLHCDTVFECFKRNTDMTDASLAVNRATTDIFAEYRQVFALWIDDRAEDPFGLFLSLLGRAPSAVKSGGFSLSGRKRGILAVEGGAFIENKPDRVELLAENGIKVMSLAWNYKSSLAGGALSDAGLSDVGRAVLKNMNAAHIACDLSHLNGRSFFEVTEHADTVLATHSNCRAVTDNPRNLSDDQLKLIAEKGGVVGICAVPAFSGEPPFPFIYENVCHMLELGVKPCIGSDFDGAVMNSELKDPSDMPRLYEYLENRGLGKEILEDLFWNNAVSFFKKL